MFIDLSFSPKGHCNVQALMSTLITLSIINNNTSALGFLSLLFRLPSSSLTPCGISRERLLCMKRFFFSVTGERQRGNGDHRTGVAQEAPGGRSASAGRTLRERLKLQREQAAPTQRLQPVRQPRRKRQREPAAVVRREASVCGVPVHRVDAPIDLCSWLLVSSQFERAYGRWIDSRKRKKKRKRRKKRALYKDYDGEQPLTHPSG